MATLINQYQATLKISIKNESTLVVTVYGLRENSDKVGVFLSDKEYFLQKPKPDQYDPATQYINPQYLLRPGSEFQRSWQMGVDSHSTEVLRVDPTTKSKINMAFDQASGPSNYSEVQITNILVTKLRV